MGVHQFMLGRELPCTVLELLDVRQMPLPGAVHEGLVRQVDGGRAYPDVLFRLGLSHLGRQELGLARQRLSAAVAQKGDYAAARLALAAVCDLLAQHADAVDQIDAALASAKAPADGPSRYRMLCASAFCLERCGQSAAAAGRYAQALAAEPQDLFAHYRLAAIHLANNQLEEAVKHHRSILNHEPQEQGVRTSLAHLLQLMGRHKEAVWEYEKALCLDPDNWELQLELADQFERMGNSDAAIGRLKNLCAKNPQFPDLHLRLANLHATRGDDHSAGREFTAALELHPEYLECHIALARHELKMGRTEGAMVHFQRATTINNRNVEAYAGLSVALHRLGKVEQSKEMLVAALKVAGNSDVLIAQLGQLELQAEAAKSLDDGLDPNQPEPSAIPPTAAERENQRKWIEHQIERYTEILEEHPMWADVRVRYGMLLKLVGRFREAAAAFELATKQNPSYVEAWVQLGMARRELGDTAGAMKALEQAIQIRPEHADLHYRLGLLYCSEMEFDLAMERMEQAVALDGKNEDFQRHLWVVMQSLQMNGRRQETGAEAENAEVASKAA